MLFLLLIISCGNREEGEKEKIRNNQEIKNLDISKRDVEDSDLKLEEGIEESSELIKFEEDELEKLLDKLS